MRPFAASTTASCLYLIAEGEPDALLHDGEAACVLVDSGVCDVREHVIGCDDVTVGVGALPPIRNARRNADVTRQQFERLL